MGVIAQAVTASVVADGVFPFDALPAAQAAMEAGQHVGKLVLRIG